MSYTTDLIDQFKSRNKITSDYAAAKALGLSQQQVTNYRSALSHADDKTAIILADALGIDRFKTIARINGERAKKPEDRAFWKRIAAAAATAIAVYVSIRPHTSSLAFILPIILHNANVVDIASDSKIESNYLPAKPASTMNCSSNSDARNAGAKSRRSTQSSRPQQHNPRHPSFDVAATTCQTRKKTAL